MQWLLTPTHPLAAVTGLVEKSGTAASEKINLKIRVTKGLTVQRVFAIHAVEPNVKLEALALEDFFLDKLCSG